MKADTHFWSHLAQFFFRMTNVSYKSCRESQNTHFVFNNFSRKSCLLRDVEKCCRAGQPQMTIWRKRIACWIPTAINTHSEHVILIALPLQQWLHKHASLLRCTSIACLVLLLNAAKSHACHRTSWSAWPWAAATRTLNGPSTVSASRQHIAAVLGLSPSDVCAEISTPANQPDLPSLLLLLLLLLLLFLMRQYRDQSFVLYAQQHYSVLCHARTVPPVSVHQL
jgi:hypothetical protein